MKLKFTLLLFILSGLFLAKGQGSVTASFTADETTVEIMKQGFDSQEETIGWQIISTNASKTWKLGNPRSYSLPDFSTIDSKSKYSLRIDYDDYNNQNEQAVSPSFKAKTTTVCRFYAMFDGVYALYAPLTVEIEDQETNARETIFNSLTWSNETGHERPKWLNFELALGKYDQKDIRVIFRYKGIYGDDVLIDDFRIVEKDESENAKVTINEGQQVHFKDASTGVVTSREWSFEGGTPATSDEENPVVTYSVAGVYKVSLKVSNGVESDIAEKVGFITVQGVAPVAAFDFPTEGYLSPEAAIFLPVNYPVTYIDKSKNVPKTWEWTLPGTENVTYSQQNPTVVYKEEGLYDASLKAINQQGSDLFDYVSAVKVGGSCHIWNIRMDESETIDEVGLSWYGYYGGSNYLDMYAFAERYEKPVSKGKVDEVDIYFMATKTVIGPVDIEVAITNEKDGLPGDVLASVILSSDELVAVGNDWKPTTFKFNEPVTVEDVFYITVKGFPNREDEDTYEIDKIVMGAVRRDFNSPIPSTTYHFLTDYDDDYNPVGEPYWVKNSDDNVSFAIAPKFTYVTSETGLTDNGNIDEGKPVVFVEDGILYTTQVNSSYSVEVYSIAGLLIKQERNVVGDNSFPLQSNGVYIVKLQSGDSSWIYKVSSY